MIEIIEKRKDRNHLIRAASDFLANLSRERHHMMKDLQNQTQNEMDTIILMAIFLLAVKILSGILNGILN